MALTFILGPTTLTWRRSVQCGHSAEITTDTLWDDFLESFCETWVHSPELTTSDVAPAVQILTANVPSLSLANASMLKHVEGISIILTTDELPPQDLSKTIDLTADDDDANNWSLFTPCASVLPLVSPPPVTVSAPKNAENVSIVLAANEVPADPSSTISNVSLANDCALPTPPTPESFTAIVPFHHPLHAYAQSRKRMHGYNADDEHEPVALPPPVEDSSGPLTPVRLHQSPPSIHPATPHRAVLHNAISLQLPSQSLPHAIKLTATVTYDATDLTFPTPLSPRRSLSHPCLKTPSPNSPLSLSLAVDNISPDALPENVELSLDDLDNTPGAVLLPSRPPSPSVAPPSPPQNHPFPLSQMTTA
ncbi:hypothetical protein EDB85DRAFT_2149162 [Lactarius pseudohatsudake]|nr:hypothetical protein EDB85DRAFT_2149162 [Lactarius pseudohatsudake]